MKFEDYNNFFDGEEAFIIGKGPTLYDYAKLFDEKVPRFFINESAGLCERYGNLDREHNIMFAHDIATKAAVKQTPNYVCMLPNIPNRTKKYNNNYVDINGTLASEYVIFFNQKLPKIERKQHPELSGGYRYENYEHGKLLSNKSRDCIARNTWLPCHIGTNRTVAMFCFYSGIRHVKFVGCDGMPKTEMREKQLPAYNNDLKEFISSRPWGSFYKYKIRVLKMLENLGITYEFLGTPV
jgi:hypothetical protein